MSAVVFTISAGTRRITAHAENLHAADETLRLATVARAQLGFANHLAAVEREFGTDVSEPLAQSSNQAIDALEELMARLDQLRSSDALAELPVPTAVPEFVALGHEVVELIDAGRSSEADILVAGDLHAAYGDAFGYLEAARDRQFELIDASDELLARLGDLARLLVAFLIPLAVILIYREIVKRQQRQAELEVRLRAEREIGAAREDFIASASHEFRTPLTSIYGLSHLIEEDPEASQATLEYASIISSEAADLSRMVEDLLTVAGLDSGALTFMLEDVPTDDEIVNILRPTRRSGAEVSVDVEPAFVRVDRLRLRQILRNLLSNAVKYGGSSIEVRGHRHRDGYRWVVRDDGDGVPDELAPKLFERFVHRDTNVVVPGGVGLGLSIVRALAEGMGGSVSYRRVDGWSEFIVDIPEARRPSGRVHSAGEKTSPGHRRSRSPTLASRWGRRG